jgi:hypothetical protein
MKWTYAWLQGKISEQIQSLAPDYQILYRNEEGDYITLSSDPMDIQDMFRCSSEVKDAEYRRLKLRIVEGCSPDVRATVAPGKRDREVQGEVAPAAKRRLVGTYCHYRLANLT